MTTDAFWRSKTLREMTREEWESLCDGCAQCCRLKLEDIDSGDIGVTDVVCELLDRRSCRCTHYAERHARVLDCIEIDADSVTTLRWLPETCAYRLVAEGRDLPEWHHLVCGDRDEVHRAGRSVRGQVQSERYVPAGDLESRIVRWIEAAPRRRC
jgi:uncharacterized cysteine cluster protein YcgN (CxxCxxCC family)